MRIGPHSHYQRRDKERRGDLPYDPLCVLVVNAGPHVAPFSITIF
jgi:hypothetical protein